jgi:hypothetical protein
MKVDLLSTESDRRTPLGESYDLHAQNSGIEIGRDSAVGDGEHEMI